MTRPVLMLEINEVPWRVVDYYLQKNRFHHLNDFFSRSATYTSISTDTGELSPWITWPSLHRGMNNLCHRIKSLGQDPKTFKGSTIWEDCRKQGLSIGIFGSLQSWPPIDPGKGGFYIPDTFAHDARCIPEYLEPLQEWNLGLVRENGRVIRDKPLVSQNKTKILRALLHVRPSLKTIFRVIQQLIAERFDKNRLARRPVFQTVLFWDVFKRLYNPLNPPAFTTFFSNHIAGLMHRYWNDLFPEDFKSRTPSCHDADFDFSIELLDEMLKDALEFQNQCPDLIVMVASSMGQGPVYRENHEGIEMSVAHLNLLMAGLGFNIQDYKPLLAMVPQVALEANSAETLQRIRCALENLKTASGKNLFRCEVFGLSLSISLITPRRSDIEAGYCQNESQTFRWPQIGVDTYEIDSGTGYHIPEGILAVVGKGISPSAERGRIWATDIKSMIETWAGFSKPQTTERSASAKHEDNCSLQSVI